MSEQKLREALDCICSAKLCSINSMSSRVEMLRLMDLAIDKLREALAAPAGEQVGLTEGRLLAALNDAAKSLATISNLAGKDDFMETMLDVRSYARSRANVAADEVNRHIEAKRNGGAA